MYFCCFVCNISRHIIHTLLEQFLKVEGMTPAVNTSVSCVIIKIRLAWRFASPNLPTFYINGEEISLLFRSKVFYF